MLKHTKNLANELHSLTRKLLDKKGGITGEEEIARFLNPSYERNVGDLFLIHVRRVVLLLVYKFIYMEKHCCSPVKVDIRNVDDLPKDKNGNTIFTLRNEILIPESRVDTVRLKTFDCKNFDPVTKKCLDHESRPDLCRDATCITDPGKSVDEQHKKVTDEHFIRIFPT